MLDEVVVDLSQLRVEPSRLRARRYKVRHAVVGAEIEAAPLANACPVGFVFAHRVEHPDDASGEAKRACAAPILGGDLLPASFAGMVDELDGAVGCPCEAAERFRDHVDGV